MMHVRGGQGRVAITVDVAGSHVATADMVMQRPRRRLMGCPIRPHVQATAHHCLQPKGGV